jgi:hypothetical protein
MPEGNMALATDPNVMWRIAKVSIEKYSRVLGIDVGNTRLLRWLAQEIRRVFKGQNMPAHWIQSAAGILASAWLQSPPIFAKILSRITGLDEGKLHRLFNEGLDAGVLAVATQIEKNANRPENAQDVVQGTGNAIDAIIAKLRGKGLFEDLDAEEAEGEKFLTIITQLSVLGDDADQALAHSFLDRYATANSHHRSVLEDIGQQQIWKRQEISILLGESTTEGVLDLNTLIRLMTLKKSRSRFRRTVSFAGAVLTGDSDNPDFKRVLADVDRSYTRLEESNQRGQLRQAVLNEILNED